MRILQVDPERPEAALLEQAAAVLRRGGLVAFPTETVYGLGAHALDPAAVARIYAAKGRPGYNPLIVHVPDAARARALAGEWSDAADRLAARFWPGPLTLVVPRADGIPDAVTAGLDSVGIRVPAHPVAHALLEVAGMPVAAPSANRSMRVSPTTAEHVLRGLGDRVELILDGGATPVGIESTVLSLAGPFPTLLRPGSISLDALRAELGEVRVAAAEGAGEAARPSPGMLDRHYAPRGEVRLFAADERASLLSALAERERSGAREGVIGFAPLADEGAGRLALPRDPAAYAARLYAALHQLDDEGCAVIWIERVPTGGEWAGIADRLRRAATGP